MKKRLLKVLCFVLAFNLAFSTFASAASVNKGTALIDIINTAENENFAEVTKVKAYKKFKDHKSFDSMLKSKINVALANKIIKKSKKFNAKKAITRIELASWISAAMKKTGLLFVVKKCKYNPEKFKDVKKKADKKVVKYVHKYGVMTGVSKKKFAPKKKVSKKEYKKIFKNFKKAFDTAVFESEQPSNPEDEPTEEPTSEPGVESTPGITNEPGILPTPDVTNIPDEMPETIPHIQLAKNAWMETTEGYESNATGGINHVKGYVGNGIKINEGETVTTTLDNLVDAKGEEITFLFDVKKLGNENGQLEIAVEAVDSSDVEKSIVIAASELEDGWDWYAGSVQLGDDDKTTDFKVKITATGGTFVIDNFNVLAYLQKVIRRATYRSDDFEIKAQVDMETCQIYAYLPKAGNFELITESYGEGFLNTFFEDVTKVDTDNTQLLLEDGYTAVADKAGKVDYNVTVDGKKYVLFSGNGDASGMRNYLSHQKAQLFVPSGDWTGSLLTSDTCEFVDLFADGQYLGVYTMVEDITERTIDNLDFMIEFNASEGQYTVGNKKYNIVNDGSMSAADVQAYMNKVDSAFLAYNTAKTTAQKNVADTTFDGLVDISSYIDWTLFNEYFVTKNATFNKKVYAYKLKDGKLQFAVWDDYSLSNGNDTSVTIKQDAYYHVWLSDWGTALMNNRVNYPQQIYNRWFYCRWYVFNKFENQFETYKTEVESAYKYDVQLWGTKLDGMDAYGEWLNTRIAWIEEECKGY